MFHARDGAIFSKNSTFVFFDGASPVTENGIQLRSPSPIMAPDAMGEIVRSLVRANVYKTGGRAPRGILLTDYFKSPFCVFAFD